jgi:hypothetical protein
MLEVIIRSRRGARYLTTALILAVAGSFCSCATEKPKNTALISDPDAQRESSIPWNKPAKWETGSQVPGGIGGVGGAGVGNPNDGPGF